MNDPTSIRDLVVAEVLGAEVQTSLAASASPAGAGLQEMGGDALSVAPVSA